MCKCCWKIIKCPAKAVCCCCECACQTLLGGICIFLVLAVIIGLIVYFTVFFNKDQPDPQTQAFLYASVTQAPTTFKELFKPM